MRDRGFKSDPFENFVIIRISLFVREQIFHRKNSMKDKTGCKVIDFLILRLHVFIARGITSPWFKTLFTGKVASMDRMEII